MVGALQGEEGAGLDGVGGGPVIYEAGDGAVDCFCDLGQNLGVILRGLLGNWRRTFSV